MQDTRAARSSGHAAHAALSSFPLEEKTRHQARRQPRFHRISAAACIYKHRKVWQYSYHIVNFVAFPMLLITALLIFAEDRGPIFYRQERVGKDGHPFMVLKFRSMRADAERCGTPQWATANDPRTTRVGRIIRLLRIDEFQ